VYYIYMIMSRVSSNRLTWDEILIFLNDALGNDINNWNSKIKNIKFKSEVKYECGEQTQTCFLNRVKRIVS